MLADEPQISQRVIRRRKIAAGSPFYVELEEPLPPGGLPRPAPLRPNIRNEHLQYAITWYGLAAVLIVMLLFWVRTQRRKPS